METDTAAETSLEAAMVTVGGTYGQSLSTTNMVSKVISPAIVSSQEGGAYRTNNGGSNADNNTSFLGVDERALRCPPCEKEPHMCKFPNGTTIKWCSICGSWGTHFRTSHTIETDISPADDAT